MQNVAKAQKQYAGRKTVETQIARIAIMVLFIHVGKDARLNGESRIQNPSTYLNRRINNFNLEYRIQNSYSVT